MRVSTGVAAAGMIVAALAGARAEPGEPGFGVSFNQTEIERLEGAPTFDIKDEMAVFGHVFAALPDAAKVYPTENYYYFSFVWGGVPFGGNLRLDASDRDDGVVHFAYFPNATPWAAEMPSQYRRLTGADGVEVERLDRLEYAVTFEDRTVRFSLNDLTDVAPSEGALRDSERYLGPVFDESGIRFFLVFDDERKDFLFLLDETEEVNDALRPVHPDHPALTIGVRTGFAVYEDRFAPRKVLVGVNGLNVDLNNYFDGPFDQLPDNFIKGEEMREAMIARSPSLEGNIDRYGAYASGEGRVLVAPYRIYNSMSELEALLRCSDPVLDEPAFYDCLTSDR